MKCFYAMTVSPQIIYCVKQLSLHSISFGENTLQTCFFCQKAGLSLKKDYNKYFMIIKTFKAKERPDQLPIFSLLAPKE